MDRRELKAHIFSCLGLEDAQAMEEALRRLPGRRAAGPLMGAFCHGEGLVSWRAVQGLGAVCEGLFPEDPEGVRQIMRRLIWMLNDESGGIGWGCGEAMGEIMARIPSMAWDYHRILCAYMNPCGNHLENPFLQQGVLWGLARLAQTSPRFVQDMGPFLKVYLESRRPEILVPALLLCGVLCPEGVSGLFETLETDSRRFSFYREGDFVEMEIGRLARDVREGCATSWEGGA